MHKGLFEALKCTTASLEHWRSFGRHKELGGAAAVHIEEFGPCKCSIVVHVLVLLSKSADLSEGGA